VSPELLGLLRACKDAPDDDAPRLVLADWLEERNGPTDADRAALIRVQCHRARMKEGSAEHKALVSREQELITLHRDALLGPLSPYGRLWRGLLDVMIRYSPFFSADVTDALRDGPGVWLDSLVLYGVPQSQVRRLASRSFLSRLSSLSVSGRWDDEGLATFLDSPHLTGLRQLILGVRGITAAGARALAEWAPLARLDHLDLTGNPLGDEGLAALAASPNVTHLRTLCLTNVKIGPAGVRALASSPHLAGLRELHLAVNAVGDEGAGYLADSPHLGRLEWLILFHSAVTGAGFHVLRQRFGDALHAQDTL
jgi:uncharacterized protein (TIGR02996 family)